MKQTNQKNVIFITCDIYKLDISQGIEIDETNKSKECDIYHYWCLMQKAMSFNDVSIVSINGNNYRIHFWYMSKSDAIVLMTNSNLKDKNGIL